MNRHLLNFFGIVMLILGAATALGCDDSAQSEHESDRASAAEGSALSSQAAGSQTTSAGENTSALSTSLPHPTSQPHDQLPQSHHEPGVAGGDHQCHGGLAHSFADAEHWATVFDAPERSQWQHPDEVITLMNLDEGSVVADLGAGTGYFLPFLSAAVGSSGRVLALDVEPSLVAYMTDRVAREALGNVEVLQVPYDAPGLDPGAVDRILIVDTWHHISDRNAYAAEILAALRPGGSVYIVDFTLEAEQGPPVEHRLRPELVVRELEAGGLTVEILGESLPSQYVVVGRRDMTP